MSHINWQQATKDLSEQVDALESRVTEVEDVRNDQVLISDALNVIRRVLADLIDASPVDASEYEDDLDNLSRIEHLIR
jgi:hypothetical protein